MLVSRTVWRLGAERAWRPTIYPYGAISVLHRLRRNLLNLVTDSPVEPLLRAAYARLNIRAADTDRRLTELIRAELKPNSNCLDIGCYRGQILREIVRAAPAGRHVAFEPIPANCRYLRRRFPEVEIRCCALSDEFGETNFHYVRGRPARSGLRRGRYPDPDESVEEISVPVTTLDRALIPGSRVDFVKIDVEGAELQVLRGAQQLLLDQHPTLVFEHTAQAAGAYGTSSCDIFELFHSLGYELAALNVEVASGSLSRELFVHLAQGAKTDYVARHARSL